MSHTRIVPNTISTKTWTANAVPNIIKKMNTAEKEEERINQWYMHRKMGSGAVIKLIFTRKVLLLASFWKCEFPGTRKWPIKKSQPPKNSYFCAQLRRGSRINTDRFPKQAPKLPGGSGGMLPWEIFWILTPLSSLSWVSESFRQDIAQFHSPRMKHCPICFPDFNLKSFCEKSDRFP